MKKAVMVVPKVGSEAAANLGAKLVSWLVENGYTAVEIPPSDEKILPAKVEGVVLGVVIGGDGTFLGLVRRLVVKDAFPLIGVNLGTLGFITQLAAEEMVSSVEQALTGKYPQENRCLMGVELIRNGRTVDSGTVFNDAVVTKDNHTTMMKFNVSVAGQLISCLRADGYIVSTPTGSTAYNLSADGPLMHPEVNGLILNPINAHTLATRPLIVPDSRDVEIELLDFRGKAYLVYDGQVDFELKPGDKIRIRISEHSLRLVRPPKRTWAKALRSKLGLA